MSKHEEIKNIPYSISTRVSKNGWRQVGTNSYECLGVGKFEFSGLQMFYTDYASGKKLTLSARVEGTNPHLFQIVYWKRTSAWDGGKEVTHSEKQAIQSHLEELDELEDDVSYCNETL